MLLLLLLLGATSIPTAAPTPPTPAPTPPTPAPTNGAVPTPAPTAPTNAGTPTPAPTAPTNAGTPTPAPTAPTNAGTPTPAPTAPTNAGTPTPAPTAPTNAGAPTTPAPTTAAPTAPTDAGTTDSPTGAGGTTNAPTYAYYAPDTYTYPSNGGGAVDPDTVGAYVDAPTRPPTQGPTNRLGDVVGTWRSVPVGGAPPSARTGHSLVLLSRQGKYRIVVFGGTNNVDQTYGNLIAYDLNMTRWREVTVLSAVPPARSFHGCTTNGVSKMFIWGGQDASSNDILDLWAFDYSKRSWKQLFGQAPGPKDPLTLLKPGDFSTDGQLYIWAQSPDGVLFIYAFDLNKYEWSQVVGLNQFVRTSFSSGNDLALALDTDSAKDVVLQYTAALRAFIIAGPGLTVDSWTFDTEISGYTVWKISNISAPEVDLFYYSAQPLRTGYSARVVGEQLVVTSGVDISAGGNAARTLDLMTLDLGNTVAGPWITVWSSNDSSLSRDSAAFFASRLNESYTAYICGGETDDGVQNDLIRVTYALSSTAATVTNVSYLNPTLPVIPPRAFHSAVFVGQNLYIFGGRIGRSLPYTYLNDLWRNDIITGEIEVISDSGTPTGRAEHSAVAVGVRFIVFGGTDGNSVFNQVYALNTLEKTWVLLHDGTGVAPVGRAGHACLLWDASTMLVVGGHDKVDNIVEPNVVWLFNIDTNTWKSVNVLPIPSAGPAPAPSASTRVRNGYLMRAYYPYMSHPAAAVYQGNLVLVGGAMGPKFSSGAATLNITATDAERYWRVSLTNDTQYYLKPTTTMARIGAFGDKLVKVGGRGTSGFSDNVDYVAPSVPAWSTILKVDSFRSTAYDGPYGRVGHASARLGDSLVIFSGLTCAESKKIPFSSNIYKGDMWLLQVPNVPCTPGSVPATAAAANGATQTPYPESKCMLCPAGRYDNLVNVSTCIMCPKGRYSDRVAAISSATCLPCALGTYNDQTGQSTCKACPDNKRCGVGSINPLSAGGSNVTELVQQKPVPVTQNNGAISSDKQNLLIYVSVAVAGGLCLLLTCVFFIWERRKHRDMDIPIVSDALREPKANRNTIKKLAKDAAKEATKDGDDEEKGEEKDGKGEKKAEKKDAKGAKGAKKAPSHISCFQKLDLIHKKKADKNVLGGCFTFFWVLAFVAWAVSVIIPVVFDNLIEQRSILPFSFLDTKNLPVGQEVSLSVALLDYPADALCVVDGKCSPKTTSVYTNAPGNGTTTCELVNDACNVTWTWPAAYFKPGVHVVNFTFQESGVYATAWNYSVKSAAGYPGQYNLLRGTQVAPDGLTYRGTTPSTAVFNLQQVLYENKAGDSVKRSGYLVSPGDITDGQTVSVRQFQDWNGVSVSFQLAVDNTFYVQILIEEKLAISVVVTVILGLVATARGIVGKVLKYVEIFAPFLLRVLLCRCKADDFGRAKEAIELGKMAKEAADGEEEEGGENNGGE